jgi:hypothetical protein
MMLKCPSCGLRIKYKSKESNQNHICISCGYTFIPNKYLGIFVPYNHSEFVDSIKEKSILVTMSDESAESIIKSSKNGEVFCKMANLAFFSPWIGLLIFFFSEFDDKWKVVAFIVVSLASNFLFGYLNKLKIKRAINVLVCNSNAYDYFMHRWCLIFNDNPDFKND